MVALRNNEVLDRLTKVRETLEDARSQADDGLKASLEAALRHLAEVEGALADAEVAGRSKRPNAVMRDPPGKKGGAKYRWAIRLSELLPEPADILDLGCGNGKPIARLLAPRHNYTGVDIIEDRVERLQRALPSATFLHADYTEMEIAPSSFDAVVATATFGQIRPKEIVPMLGRIKGWLRPGGYLLATLGNRPLSGIVHSEISLKHLKDDLRGPFLETGFDLVDCEIVQPEGREPGRGRKELFFVAQRAG